MPRKCYFGLAVNMKEHREKTDSGIQGLKKLRFSFELCPLRIQMKLDTTGMAGSCQNNLGSQLNKIIPKVVTLEDRSGPTSPPTPCRSYSLLFLINSVALNVPMKQQEKKNEQLIHPHTSESCLKVGDVYNSHRNCTFSPYIGRIGVF